MTLDDGAQPDGVVLDSRDLGLCIPPLTWSTLSSFLKGTLLYVVASEVYQPDDYIRDYDEFLAIAAHEARHWALAA